MSHQKLKLAGSAVQMLNLQCFDLLFGDAKAAERHVFQSHDMQIFFEIGDSVRFSTSIDKRICGTVVKLNPKYCAVLDELGYVRSVAYFLLHHRCQSLMERRAARADRLRNVAIRARKLMDDHGLEHWALLFSAGQRSLGACRSRDKTILLSRHHALNANSKEVKDTVLHEIAHALAGPKAGHGPVWKEIASRIGAIPRSRMHEAGNSAQDGIAAKDQFCCGDTVFLTLREARVKGEIVRINPKRAKVNCGRHGVWRVPCMNLSKRQNQSSG